MPELPEVEAARRAIEENCLGKKITRAIIANDSKVIDGVSASDFESSILGKTIVSANRKGKNLWLHLDSPPFPSFQFGMAGAIYIKGVAVTKYKRSTVKDSDEWPSKYSKFFIELDDGLELCFTDKRRFAKVRLLKDVLPTLVPPISDLGPDALLEPMAINQFSESLSKKKLSIKALLLDQGYISGIGNWIADEVLYQARIHPLQVAASLSKEQCAALHKCVKEVIQYAVEVDAESSHFPPEWLFHFRWGKKPGKVKGKRIDFISAGGRTTAYVPELQKLSGNQAKKAAVKPEKQTVKRKGSKDDEEEESEDADDKAKLKQVAESRGRSKKPPVKRKSSESDESDDSNNDESDKNGDQKKKSQKVTSSRKNKLAKTPKRKVTGPNNKNSQWKK
ncbi:formamidopyrimidine-DNA glycosylase isoform X2 [Carica papaya]|uniref:formamidopyrimidine-DNA glycosylase isoform X2 n=1 Tax=Carica papaya TaxID=3649 RepID=UPI000B8CC7D5|nr:formamidopyrimidine-DNA glycosylase isoform X2 [Carica papaya]